jgi:hypothetical protein
MKQKLQIARNKRLQIRAKKNAIYYIRMKRMYSGLFCNSINNERDNGGQYLDNFLFEFAKIVRDNTIDKCRGSLKKLKSE